MQNVIWKLTAVVGVLGIGTLVVLQAQRGLNKSGDGTELTAEFDEEFVSDTAAAEEAAAPFEADAPSAFDQAPPSQFEPEPAAFADIPQSEPAADDPFSAEAEFAADASLAEPDPQSEPVFGLDEEAEDPFANSNPVAGPEPAIEVPTARNDAITDPQAEHTIRQAGHEAGPEFGIDDAVAEETPADDDGGPRMLAPNPLESAPVDVAQSEPAQPQDNASFGDPANPQPSADVPWGHDPPAELYADEEAAPSFAAEAVEQQPEPDTPQPEPVESLLGTPNQYRRQTAAADETSEPNSEPDSFSADPEPDPMFGGSAAPRRSFDEHNSRETTSSHEEPDETYHRDLEAAPRGEQHDFAAEEPEQELPSLGEPRLEVEERPTQPRTLPRVDQSQPRTLPRVDEDSEPRTLPRVEESQPLSPTPDDHLTGEATIEHDVRGAQRPQLQIEKVAPPNAVLGQPLVYSIIVRNAGQSAAHQVVVQDEIPAGTKLTGTIPRAELTDKRLSWKLGTVEPGEERTIKVRVVPTAEGQVGSIATVNFVAEVAAKTIVTAPKIDFELVGPSRARLGEPVVFNFRLSNQGTGDANGVVIRNLLPDELRHSGGNDLEYEVGLLPAGKSLEVQLTLQAAKEGQAVNRAIVTAEGGLSTESRATIDIVGTNLKITRSGPTKRYLGREAEYANTVINESDIPATGITVIEQVPPGLDFVASTAGGNYDPVRRSVTWRIDRIDPHESRDVKVKLVARHEGTHSSLVTVVDSTGDRKDVTSETSVVGFTNVGLDVSQVDSAVAVGDQVAFQIRARNSGTNPATNVAVVLMLPPGLEPISVKGPVQYRQEGRQLQFEPIGVIEGGREEMIDVVLKADAAGNGRLHFEIHADEMESPLVREEAIYVAD